VCCNATARQLYPQEISSTHFYMRLVWPHSRAGGLWKISPSLYYTGRWKSECLIIIYYWIISGEYNLLTRRRSDFVFIYSLDLNGKNLNSFVVTQIEKFENILSLCYQYPAFTGIVHNLHCGYTSLEISIIFQALNCSLHFT